MGTPAGSEIVNGLTKGSLPGFLEEVLHSSPGWGDLSWARMTAAEGGDPSKAWIMRYSGGEVDLVWNQERHDWEASALLREFPNFKCHLKRSNKGLELCWQWAEGKFRSEEVDTVLGRGLAKIIDEKYGPELCLLGGIFHLVLGPTEVSITMQTATGECGGLWNETASYALASDLLVDLQSFLEANLGKPVF